MANNQRARRARTVEAPNGARLVMAHGTTFSQVWDRILQWAYEGGFAVAISATTPLKQKMRRTTDRSRYYEVRCG